MFQQKLSWYFDSNDDFIGTETKRVRLDPNYSTRFFMCSFTNSGRRYLVGGDNSRFDQEGDPLPPVSEYFKRLIFIHFSSIKHKSKFLKTVSKRKKISPSFSKMVYARLLTITVKI